MFHNIIKQCLAGNTLNIGNDIFLVHFALRLAQQNQAVLYSLVGWGGMTLLGSDNKTARGIYKGFDLTRKRCSSAQNGDKPLTKKDYLILLTVYSLLLGAEISTGGVRYWFFYFYRRVIFQNNMHRH
ncbi:hypothetical protein FOA43_003548 [Brettanomyces nanus]|uniref:Uncharacterized protein n=1 Tax=Eeniella nana TaxID=13502 RepID=A0A875S8D0_EENNA|nr:uncharacterized protein FOA43_003548 [Brettanomyces nanus]QPG76162.1 hypothetical protein FOA43_003548 [Brettanomyces nanus]